MTQPQYSERVEQLKASQLYGLPLLRGLPLELELGLLYQKSL
jgi:hypothetical protein